MVVVICPVLVLLEDKAEPPAGKYLKSVAVLLADSDGFERLTQLKKLYISPRNWPLIFSVIGKFLKTERSMSLNPGAPWI